MANELLITLRMKEDGSYVISKVTGDIKQVAAAAEAAGSSMGKAGAGAAQAGSGFTSAGRAAAEAAQGKRQAGQAAAEAAVNYDRLGSSVAMAQAKMVALYAVVRGGVSLFQKGMESIDTYEKAIIRMAASATDAFALQNKGASDQELGAYYERMKVKYGDLVQYAMIASAKYFANAREMLMVMEFAVARGHEMSKKGIDQVGMMVDKVKQLVPWIRQEGQVLQEVSALWEGHARITDTWARDLAEKMKMAGMITASSGKAAQKQFLEILADWKKGGWESFWEKLLGFYRGAKLASGDIQNTWESTKETIGTTVDILLRVAGKEIYKDINKFAQELTKYYLTGAEAAKNQAALAERVKNAWGDTKKFLVDIEPIVSGIWGHLKNMDDGRQALPVEIQEAGIVGFFLVGTKGKVAILAILSIIGEIRTSLEGLKAWAEGNISFWEYMTSGADKLREKLDKLKGTQKELKDEGLDLLEPSKPFPEYIPGLGLPLSPMSGGGEGWGFWGNVHQAAYGGQGGPGGGYNYRPRVARKGEESEDFWSSTITRSGGFLADSLATGLVSSLFDKKRKFADLGKYAAEGLLTELGRSTLKRIGGSLFSGLFGGGTDKKTFGTKMMEDYRETATEVFGDVKDLFIDSQDSMTEAGIAGENARLSSMVGGAGQTVSILSSLAKGTILIEAGRSGAAAFTSVMEALPFPFNAILAPIAAAAAFAATLAFGSGFGGGGQSGGTPQAAMTAGAWHEGGIVYAHAGFPRLAAGEVPAILLEKEGVLPIPSMRRLGPDRFEALRSGNFEVGPAGGDGGGLKIGNIAVHIDARGASKEINWDRLGKKAGQAIWETVKHEAWLAGLKLGK